MDLTAITGITAGIFTAVSMLPQLIKLIKDKEAKDISSFAFIVLITGLGLWVAYGFMKKDIPIIATNMLSFIINGLMVILSIKYRKR